MALPIVAIPILTRLFTPHDFGLHMVFASALALVVAFCTWRLDGVLPNARTTTIAASLFVLGVLVLTITCISIAAIIPLLRLPYFSGTPLGQLGTLLFLMPVAVAGAGLRQMLSGWFVRAGDLTAVSRSTIVQSGANVASGLTAGLFNLGALGLIGASVIAAWAGIGTMFRHGGSQLRRGLRRVSLATIQAALSRHGRNATWSTLSSIVNAASLSAPLLVLAYFYSPQEIGWYALMQRMIAAPAGTLTAALSQSFWSQAAEYARARRIHDLSILYRKTTLRLGLASFPVVVICLAGPIFIGPLLGMEKWGGAGSVLAAMFPLFVGSIMFSPTNHLVVLNKQHLQLLADLARILLILCGVVLAHQLQLGFVAAVTIASFASLAGHLMLFFINAGAHRQYERRL